MICPCSTVPYFCHTTPAALPFGIHYAFVWTLNVCGKLEVMKLLVLYRPNSEFARGVEEFLRDLREVYSVDDRHLRVVDYDSPEGTAVASMYDIMNQPAIMVTDDDGGYVKHWEGASLPLQEEVAGYLHSYQD